MNIGRLLETVVGFKNDDGSDDKDRRCVNNSHDHADAVVSESHAVVGRTQGLPDCVPRKSQSNDVDENMAGITQQSQRVGDYAANEFGSQNSYAHDQADLELVACAQYVVVFMLMAHH